MEINKNKWIWIKHWKPSVAWTIKKVIELDSFSYQKNWNYSFRLKHLTFAWVPVWWKFFTIASTISTNHKTAAYLQQAYYFVIGWNNSIVQHFCCSGIPADCRTKVQSCESYLDVLSLKLKLKIITNDSFL